MDLEKNQELIDILKEINTSENIVSSLINGQESQKLIYQEILLYINITHTFILSFENYPRLPKQKYLLDLINDILLTINNGKTVIENPLFIKNKLSEIIELIPNYKSTKLFRQEWREFQNTKTSYDELCNKLKTTLHETQKTIEKQLEGASQIGLGKAFLERQHKLEKSKFIFLISFFIGLSLLLISSLYFLDEFKKFTIDPQTSTTASIYLIISKIYIVIPIVWATWFSARQYSNINRITEDYAFKTTSAISFVGYKKETEHDPDMKQALLLTAIRNFGENPTRLLNKKECVSPIQETFQAFEIINEFSNKFRKNK